MPKTDVTTWYLEFEGATPAPPTWPPGVQLVEAVTPNPEWSQFLFCAVGRRFGWYSRLSWDYGQWRDLLLGGDVRTWVLWHGGTPAGYLELVRHVGDVAGAGPGGAGGSAGQEALGPGAGLDDASWLQEVGAGVEVKFLGLLPAFCGLGLGSGLVRASVHLAREWAPGAVWLHTCSADHPAALRLYEREGFVVRRTAFAVEDIPDADDPRQLCAPFVRSAIRFHGA